MKHITHKLKIFAVVLTAIFISTSGLAATGKGVISLNPTKAHANAGGTAFIDSEHVSIRSGLLIPSRINMKLERVRLHTCLKQIDGAMEIIQPHLTSHLLENGQWL